MLTVSSAEFSDTSVCIRTKRSPSRSPLPAMGASGLSWCRRMRSRCLKRRAREALPVEALSDADLEAIARTEMAPRHRHLDHELK